jgi:hypothetical protein
MLSCGQSRMWPVFGDLNHSNRNGCYYVVPGGNSYPNRKSQLENLLYDWLSYCNWRIRIQKISRTELTRITITPGDYVNTP